jgi:hypothetical protein
MGWQGMGKLTFRPHSRLYVVYGNCRQQRRVVTKLMLETDYPKAQGETPRSQNTTFHHSDSAWHFVQYSIEGVRSGIA